MADLFIFTRTIFGAPLHGTWPGTIRRICSREHFKHASLWMTDYYVGSDLELWTLMMEEEEKLFFESFDKALGHVSIWRGPGRPSEEKDRRGDCRWSPAEGVSGRGGQPSAQGDDP